jgi:hypothetical protein
LGEVRGGERVGEVRGQVEGVLEAAGRRRWAKARVRVFLLGFAAYEILIMAI